MFKLTVKYWGRPASGQKRHSWMPAPRPPSRIRKSDSQAKVMWPEDVGIAEVIRDPNVGLSGKDNSFGM